MASPSKTAPSLSTSAAGVIVNAAPASFARRSSLRDPVEHSRCSANGVTHFALQLPSVVRGVPALAGERPRIDYPFGAWIDHADVGGAPLRDGAVSCGEAGDLRRL